jgi:hypothetical protein
MVVKDGPKVSMDMFQRPGETVINRLVIQDSDSQASMGLKLREKEFTFQYAGHLKKTTTDRLLVESRLPDGWIEGDFKAHILMDQPVKSRAQGRLQMGDLLFPWEMKVPVRIDHVSLSAKETHVRVESARFAWGSSHMALEGDMDFSPAGLRLMLDLSSDGIEWDQVETTLGTGKGKEGAPKEKAPIALPVEGTLGLKSEYLRYQKLTWTPFHATISFDNKGAEVAVNKAHLCGISTPGVLRITPGYLSLDLRPVAENGELGTAASCLSDREVQMTGTFDLKGEIRARGRSKDLTKTIQGPIELSVRDGKIHRYIPMSNLFAYLNVTEVFKGQLPDPEKKAFVFKSLAVKGSFGEGRLTLREAVLDSPSMELACQGYIDYPENEMDLTILAAPLKTVDSVVEKIPLVGYILDGHLVTIPVRVKGDLRNPKVTPLAPSAVGSGLLGIMKRTLKLPIKVIDPLTPE